MVAANSEKGKRPAALSVAVDAVPEQLRAVPHWVARRYVWKPPRGEAAGKWDKPPLVARTGKPASSTDPATWSTFAEAVAAYRKGGYDGVGFVVHKAGEGCKAHGGGPGSCPHADDVVVLDLDKCRDPETGGLQPWAAEIVEQLASYAEASPSGAGVRGVALGRKPAGRCRKGGFEVYESGRYVTITGQRFPGSPAAAEERQEAVGWIHARVFAPKQNKDDKGEGNAPKSAARRNDDGGNLGDDDVVALAERAANAPKFRALMNGDTSGHSGDDSAADAALCCVIAFYTRDAAQIERIFGRSKLADRAKWRERADYRKLTIDAALERVTVQYRPPQPSANGRAGGGDAVPPTVGKQSADQDDDAPQTAAQIILRFFRQRYRPAFRRGNAVVTHEGDTVPQSVACSVPTSTLIDALAAATDAPRYAGHQGQRGDVKRDALPRLFATWTRVAWGDLLSELPDEDAADLGQDAPAAEEFRRLVREALFTDVVLGTVIRGQSRHDEVTQTERRTLVGWCQKLAKPGPWRDIRGKRCWCRLRERPGGELELQVAVRHELFAQLHADARLRDLGAGRFTRLCAKYGVGQSTRTERPHGQAAVVLHADLIADLVSGLPGDDAAADAAPGMDGDIARARDNEFHACAGDQKAKFPQEQAPQRDADG